MNILRISLVKMVYATIKKRNTPSPFMELRAFIFLRKMPRPVEIPLIKKKLENSLQEIIDKLLPHIFYTDKNEYIFDPKQTEKLINVTTSLTRFSKVEIDGFEVQQTDLDEIFYEKLFWEIEGRKIPFIHKFFSDTTLKKRMPLKLRTGVIYRYMAFYDEEGNIKGEYDEADIQEMLEKVEIVVKRFELQRNIYKSAVSVLDKLIFELESAMGELEAFSRKFKVK